MKCVITVLFLCSIGTAFAQNSLSEVINKKDTIPVVAFCLTDTANLKLECRKLYGVRSLNDPCIVMNGIVLYKSYLMNDRKTPVNFKVIYSVNR